jgi:hypothetical protein
MTDASQKRGARFIILSKNDKRKYEKLKSDIKEILGAVGAEAEIGDIDDVSSSALANLLKSRR